MKLALATFGAVCIASTVAAQGFHGGVTLDYAFPHSGDSQTATSILGGFTLGSPTFQYGLEVEGGFPLGGNTDYSTSRARLIGIYDFGEYEALATAGLTWYDFPRGTDEGQNVGLGVQRDFSPRMTLRGEFIRDFMDDSFTAAVTTTRIAVIYNF